MRIITMMALSLSLIVAGNQSISATETNLNKFLEENSVQAKNIKLVSNLFAACGHVDNYDQMLMKDVVLHGPALGQETRGIENLKALDKELTNQYTSVFLTIDEIFAYNDKVVVFWTTIAIKNQQETQVKGHGIYRINYGKICEIWQTWDTIDTL